MELLLDRTQAPQAGPLKKLALPEFHIHTLSNGIQVYVMSYGAVEVVEIKAIYKAGYSFQQQVGIAGFSARNMLEGTAKYTSLALAQELDRYGAWLNHDIGNEYISFNLATVSQHLADTLPLMASVLSEASFPEQEFEKMKLRTQQKLEVNARKTAYQARRIFEETMWGVDHPYGMHLGMKELEAVQLERLKSYAQQYFRPENMVLSVVGNFDEKTVLALLDQHFGQVELGETPQLQSRAVGEAPILAPQRVYHEIEGMQATVCLGHMGMSRSHPDYYKMTLVNTVYGGFFGSRLMKKIREEKGYTYGIYASWVAHRHGGYLLIQGDVGNQYIEPTITEIKSEMRKLISDGVSQEELETVKNYMLGRSISLRETPFQMGDILRYSIVNDITFQKIDEKFEIILQMSAEEVQETAARHLQPDQLLEVIAGKLD